MLRVVAPGGGIQTYLRTVALALDSTDVTLSVASMLPGQRPQWLNEPAYLPEQPMRRITALWRFAVWLRGALYRYDVVHVHGVLNWQMLVAGGCSLLRGTPFVVSPHACLMDEARSLWSWRSHVYWHLVARHLLARAAAIVATTRIDAEQMAGLNSGFPIKVVTPGIELTDVRANFLSAAQSPQSLKIVYMGRVDARKDLQTLLRAVALLREAGRAVTLEIIGGAPPDYQAQLNALSEQLSLQDILCFHGYLSGDAKLAVMRRAQVYVLPSKYENFGFAVGEAAALGLPVIVSDGVALAGMVMQYDAGHTFPIGDASALADAIARFFDVKLLHQAGANSLRMAQSEFSLPVMGVSLRGVYRQAAGDNASQ